MNSLFLGLSAANLLFLLTVFGLGLVIPEATDQVSSVYGYHLTLAVGAGLLTALTHMSIYMYFMATSKWLAAAADKAALEVERFVAPAVDRKRRCFAVVMGAVGLTMLAMFAGAATDTIASAPAKLHLILAVIAVGANLIGAMMEYRLIQQQGALMDQALSQVNQPKKSSAA